MYTHSKYITLYCYTLFLFQLLVISLQSMESPRKHGLIDSVTEKKKENIFDVVKRERLICFLNDKTKKDTDELMDQQPDITEDDDESLQEYVKERLKAQLNPSESLKLRKTCALLKKSNYWPGMECSLDDDTLDQLELLKGKHGTAGHSVIEKLKTESSVGHVTTCAQLLHPLTRCSELNSRQRNLEKVQRMRRELAPLLAQAGKTENGFLSFFQLQGEGDYFTFVLQSEQTKLPLAKKSKIIADLQTAWNKNETCILVKMLYPTVVGSISMMQDGAKNVFKWRKGEISTEEQYIKMFGEMGLEVSPPLASPEGLIHRTLKLFAPEKWAQFLGYGLNICYQGRCTTDVTELMKGRWETVKCMQKKVIELNHFIKNTQAIALLLEETDEPSLQEIAKKLKIPESPKVTQLKESLNTPTFNGKESFWSHWGRIKATYKLIHECKNELLTLYGALGELDFLNTGVGLIADNKVPFCLPTFIESDKPGLAINECWNVLRDPSQSVKNSFMMGQVENKDNPRSFVITGPNGEGKTENMLASFYAALLAQAICVAPGKEMKLVPCQQFLARLKAETNISRDRSLFMADVERMADILKKIEEEKGITFVILDEPGTGTKRELGRSLVKVLMQEIAANKRTLCQTTTHFDRPTTLASDDPRTFENRKAVAYRIEPGIGTFEKEKPGIDIVEKYLGSNIAEKVKRDMDPGPALNCIPTDPNVTFEF